MRDRLEAGLDLHTLDADGLADLVQSLWSEQRQSEQVALSKHGGFVSDRSSVDFAAFWLHYGFAQDIARAELFLTQTLQHAGTYDRIIVLPWRAFPLVADGYRSSNPWIQKRFQALLEGLFHRDVSPDRVVFLPTRCVSIDRRVQWVCQAIGRLESAAP
jgi:hypothetical protein